MGAGAAVWGRVLVGVWAGRGDKDWYLGILQLHAKAQEMRGLLPHPSNSSVVTNAGSSCACCLSAWGGGEESQTAPASTAWAAHALLLHSPWQHALPEQVELAQSWTPTPFPEHRKSAGEQSPQHATVQHFRYRASCWVKNAVGGEEEQSVHFQDLVQNSPPPGNPRYLHCPWK